MLFGPRRSLLDARRAAAWTPALPTTDGGVLPDHWYRSDDAYQDAGRTTPVAADGDVVGNWTDLTANADHVSQATTGNKPTWQNGVGDQLNGHPVIRFDGIDDWLRGTYTTGGALSIPFNLFLVSQLDPLVVNDGTRHAFTDGNDGLQRMICAQNNTPTPDSWSINGAAFVDGGPSNSNWNLWTVLFNGVTSQFWHNGISEAIGNAGSPTPGGLQVGAIFAAAQPVLGNIAEVIIYNSYLSVADKNQVGNYASTRYSVAYTDI